MGTRTTHHRRIAPALLAGALLLVPLAGCGEDADPDAADTSPEVTATESEPAEDTSSPAETSGPEETTPQETTPQETGATGTEGGAAAQPTTGVDCSGTSCTVTLAGDGAQTEVLGTEVSLGSVEGGAAAFRVGNQELSCTQGERVSAGPLTLECTTVGENSVTMTASLG